MIKKASIIGALIIGAMSFTLTAYADEVVTETAAETITESTEETTEHVFVYADENDEVGDDSADNPPMQGEANTTPTWGRTKEVEEMLKQWQEEDAAKEATRVYRDPGRVAFYTSADKESIPADCIFISLINLDDEEFVNVLLEREKEFFTAENIPAGKYYVNAAYAWDKERGTNVQNEGHYTAKAFVNGVQAENNTFELVEGTNNTAVQIFLNEDYKETTTIPDKTVASSEAEDDTEDGSMLDFGKYVIPAACIVLVIIAGVAAKIKVKKLKDEEGK